MTWMTFSVPSILEGARLTLEMQNFVFTDLGRVNYLAANPTAAFFGHTEIEEDTETFYFTPSAIPLWEPYLTKYRAVACEPPKKTTPNGRTLPLLLGDMRARELLAT